MSVNRGMEMVRATEWAALTAALWQGLGKPDTLLGEARQAIIAHTNKMRIKARLLSSRFDVKDGTYAVPEYVGCGGEEFDIILCAADGHKSCAEGMPNIASYAALAPKGGFLAFPDVYMYKIAVGFRGAHEVIDINQSVTINIKRVARALNKHIENTSVCVLKRKRHESIIEEIRQCGARIVSISDGDISSSIATVTNDNIDMSIGIGGAQEGVITAAALRCIGGYVTGKIHATREKDREKLKYFGLENADKVYTLSDMCSHPDTVVAGTGITDGTFLDGVKLLSDGAFTSSFIARSQTKTQRYMQSRHYFDYKPVVR